VFTTVRFLVGDIDLSRSLWECFSNASVYVGYVWTGGRLLETWEIGGNGGFDLRVEILSPCSKIDDHLLEGAADGLLSLEIAIFCASIVCEVALDLISEVTEADLVEERSRNLGSSLHLWLM